MSLLLPKSEVLYIYNVSESHEESYLIEIQENVLTQYLVVFVVCCLCFKCSYDTA